MSKLYIVATPIGNLSDFSPRAISTLSQVQLIAAEDTSHTLKLLNHFSINTPMISYHKYNEAERTQKLIQRILNEDIDIALVTDAGTPCISDPGYDLVRAARRAGISVIGIPGPCAAITALSICGFPTDYFAFIGFLPRDKQSQQALLCKMEAMDIETFVLYESPLRILDTLNVIAASIPCEVCVCNDMTKLHEYSVAGDIADIVQQLAENPKTEKGEYVIILHKYQKAPAQPEAAPALSLEALLIDAVVKQNCSLKEAILLVKQANPDLSKRDLYTASLHLKTLLEN